MKSRPGQGRKHGAGPEGSAAMANRCARGDRKRAAASTEASRGNPGFLSRSSACECNSVT
jgi:hypothetical protein